MQHGGSRPTERAQLRASGPGRARDSLVKSAFLNDQKSCFVGGKNVFSANKSRLLYDS